MDSTDRALVTDLQRLVRRLNEMPDTREPQETRLGALVREHLGVDAHAVPVTSERISPHRLADADIALATVASDDPEARLVGVAGGMERHHEDTQNLLAHRYTTFAPGPVEYVTTPTGPHSTRQTVAFGLHLFRFDGAPVAVLVRNASPMHGRDAVTVDVLAAEGDVSSRLIARLHEAMNEFSVIRGNVVSFTSDEYGQGLGGLTFLRRPSIGADDIVLPRGVLDGVRGHIIGISEKAEALRAYGQHLKRGVLLYGPPGTGKTLTVEHLLSATPGRTAILLQGGSLRHVAEAARLARAMTPALLVFEDVDLVAMERGMFGGPQPLLFEILDALDGVGGDADIAFLLTTNRADLLEPALAQRPGRVDLAVEIPLPDAAARRTLLALYAAGTPLSPAALDTAADRSEGVTASFAKELIRRAALRAALADTPLSDEHLDAALDEMLDAASAMARSFAGAVGEDHAGPQSFGHFGSLHG
ncbi:ATP-binding protein [Microbacterium sp. CFBP9034]|uniref:ATP-binding protein n=1 Tax=Microbacterium sp. CFBP9034 TaxID=3096540 RepID=UPI002A6A8D2F|nr:ATP-binding protein [Microbacterium sp. CFBP9034]MDY0910654.1 ATP-binding protein [Microbacterium sp. CFBP9034]